MTTAVKCNNAIRRSPVPSYGIRLINSLMFAVLLVVPFGEAAFCTRSMARIQPSCLPINSRRNAPKQHIGAMLGKKHVALRSVEERSTSQMDSPVAENVCTRRRIISSVVGTTLMTASLFLRQDALVSFASVDSANAFDNTYPSELSAPNERDAGYSDSRSRAVEKIRIKEAKRASNVLVASPVLSSITWGSALWLLSGSRSNPLATPLANLLYNSTQEVWLQDRNDGLFASLPWEYLIILSLVFLALGFGTNILVTTIADGDKVTSLQLAGVSFIAGCTLELGRIASGTKKQTRQESNRSLQLSTEFAQFASDRLIVGSSAGNCHRNEVVRAFRRYYAKYRQADNVDYPLTDLEIEQLLRAFCRQQGLSMSSAGFYSGVQINQEADAFARKS